MDPRTVDVEARMPITAAAGQARVELDERHRSLGWELALRGVLAVIFGLIAVRHPMAAASAFVIVFAVYAFADGLIELVEASTFRRMGMRWGWHAFGALVSVAAGVIALAYPRVTLLILVLLVGARAIITGVVEFGAAFSWRESESRWLLGVTGALSVILGVLLWSAPVRGGLALLWVIGIYAIVFGAMLFIAGLRLVSRSRRSSRDLTMGHPAPA